MDYSETIIWAEKYNGNLRSDDTRFEHCVHVCSHLDSTSLFFVDAFVISKNNFYIVFTEHNGFSVFSPHDYKISMLKTVKIKEYEGD